MHFGDLCVDELIERGAETRIAVAHAERDGPTGPRGEFAAEVFAVKTQR